MGRFLENKQFPPISNYFSQTTVLLEDCDCLYTVSFFSFEFDELVPEVAMVRLSIVLNCLNTAEITTFKQYLMKFQEIL